MSTFYTMTYKIVYFKVLEVHALEHYGKQIP